MSEEKLTKVATNEKRIEYVEVAKGDEKFELCVVLCFKDDWRVYLMRKGFTSNWGPTMGRKFSSFLQAIEFVEGLGYELVMS